MKPGSVIIADERLDLMAKVVNLCWLALYKKMDIRIVVYRIMVLLTTYLSLPIRGKPITDGDVTYERIKGR
jgi:hypothetical protein